jgi:hypothetical protein
MILKRIFLAAAMTAFSIPALADEGIVVGYKNVVEPDAELVEFSEQVLNEWTGRAEYDFAAIDRLFAPKVKTFMKNETPLRPFEARADIASDYLMNSVFTLQAKKGSIPQEEVSEYRSDAMTDIASRMDPKHPWGTLPDVPGMICRDAAFDFDQMAVGKFARETGVRIDELVFYRKAITLYVGKSRKSAVVAVVPPRTLMAMGKENVFMERWHPMISSAGIKGYMGDIEPHQTLVQKHVCFSKVDGNYKISALFGYGF